VLQLEFELGQGASKGQGIFLMMKRALRELYQYLLPKIHKLNNPGRPIVSANGYPTTKYPNSSISTFDLM
jgi:hypothetical protein